MAGRGPAPKPAALRQRRNKTSTRASLPSRAEAADFEVPDLPERADGDDWRPEAVAFWGSVWQSPMASEWVDSDIHGLHRLTDLVHRRSDPDVSDSMAVTIDKELRIGGERYGLDPIARRRLQWEVARGEEAEQKRKRTKPKREDEDGDPRMELVS